MDAIMDICDCLTKLWVRRRQVYAESQMTTDCFGPFRRIRLQAR